MTIAGKMSDDLRQGTQASILKQAGSLGDQGSELGLTGPVLAGLVPARAREKVVEIIERLSVKPNSEPW